LTAETARPDGRVVIPYAGFLDRRILKVLIDAHLHELLERIVGRDFYLSNTWYQAVPPGGQRLAYHKDPRGSISFNIMLNDVEPGMGCTCLVPGSHINTPPARYSMSDIGAPHPREIDLTGKAGDCVLFSTETWHARSANITGKTSRRLFYNFFSRSSRDTTTWNGIAEPHLIEEMRDSFPPEYRHLFDIDAFRTRRLADIDSSPVRKWVFAKSTSDTLLRDFAYAAYAYGRKTDNSRETGALFPFTTRLTEARSFRAFEYLSYIKPVPALKNLYVFLRSKLRQALKPYPPQARVAVVAD
jgi:hypothetical protein